MNTEFEVALQRSDNWMVVCANVLDGVIFNTLRRASRPARVMEKTWFA
ncbi:hypothetical protein [Burkholderia vietnamiensis]|nr:hypothetical protein [Burkholderia vietnamiensis]